jgi:ethylene-insensitive protein 2
MQMSHTVFLQSQRSHPVAAIGALSHDHFFTILFIFTGLFLVYFIIINSAAVLSSTADVILNVQDVVLLMDQVYFSLQFPSISLYECAFSLPC